MISVKFPKLVIFLTEAVCMMIELCASYLFSPYFGTSNIVWTGIIGVILLSASVGNYIGGRFIISNKVNNNTLPLIFMSASVFTFLMVLISGSVCDGMDKSGASLSMASLCSAFLLLAPPSVCMGMVPPIIMSRVTAKNNKKQIRRRRD